MRHDYRCASGKRAAQGFADLQFGFRVDAGGGLIENQEARIVGQGAGEVDELALADGKRGAALVDAGGGAIRKRANEFAEANFLESALDRRVLDEIGRASCRERVYISRGSVRL